jgi:hypothetical protein
MELMDKQCPDLKTERPSTRNGEISLEQFWSEPNHARLIDAETVRSCFACATAEALGGMQLARKFSLLGNYLATWIKLGKDAFLEELKLRSMNAESPNIKTTLDFHASMKKMMTDRGLELFLAKQIPCSCLSLDEDQKNAKQAPKTGRCSYCVSQDLKMRAEEVQPVQVGEYCWKHFQVADWRSGHKEECKGLKQ